MKNGFGGLRAVAIIELVKGVLVLVAAGLLVGVLPTAVQSAVEVLVHHFHMNPARHDPQVLVEALREFGNSHKLIVGIGAICYATVRFIEAFGLWRARSWAWGFGVISGALYIPFELAELSRHVTWAGLTVLVVNIIVVAVLWHGRAEAR